MPGFYALIDGPTGQEQSDDRVKPVPSKRGSRAKPEQHGPGSVAEVKVCALVIAAFVA